MIYNTNYITINLIVILSCTLNFIYIYIYKLLLQLVHKIKLMETNARYVL